MDLLPPDMVARLREALRACGYGYDGVAGLLGPTAHAALSRNETTPARRATAGGSPLATLVRLWPLQAAVRRRDADRALPGLVEGLAAAGILEVSGGEVRALVGLAMAVEPAATPLHDTPNYPTAEELRAGAAAQSRPNPNAVRRGLDLLRDVNMDVTAQIGSTRMTISELLALHEGAVVELDRAAGAPADLLVNGHLIARGEVVVIDENFALRITEIISDETAPHSS